VIARARLPAIRELQDRVVAGGDDGDDVAHAQERHASSQSQE
jgi:hypothetical protein